MLFTHLRDVSPVIWSKKLCCGFQVFYMIVGMIMIGVFSIQYAGMFLQIAASVLCLNMIFKYNPRIWLYLLNP